MQLGLPFTPAPRAAANDGVPAPTRGRQVASKSAGPIAPVYFVRHRRARRYLLRVEGDGGARVTILRGGSRREAEAFVERHRDWIAKQRARLTSSIVEPDQERRWRASAERVLPARLRGLAREHGLEPGKVSIRDQRTRWGSCGRDGHICLNWRLVLMPDWVTNYVLIHELMHLCRLDHSPLYWGLVASACPEYRHARQWLRVNGPALR